MLCGYRGCEGAWGSRSAASPKPTTTQAPAIVSPKQQVAAEVAPSWQSDGVAKASTGIQNGRSQADNLPQRQLPTASPEQAREQTSSQATNASSGTSSQSLGALVDTYFKRVDENDLEKSKKDSFWVSPSLAAWLTGKDRQAKARDDAKNVKDLVEEAVDHTGHFRRESTGDDEHKGTVSVDIDFATSNNGKKKLIITGEPGKRKEALNILKELTSKCQEQTASSLIDSWQMFSDDQLREATPTSNVAYHPKFGVPPGSRIDQEVEIGARGKLETVDRQGVSITTLRRNLVTKYEQRHKVEEDHHHSHRSDHEEPVLTQVLKLSFPLAALPAPDIPTKKFEAEMKKCLIDYKKDSVASIQRVAVSFFEDHATADVTVPAAEFEDLRSTFARNPPVVCGFKALVPEKLVWCNLCQKEHEPDKLCYKNFQTNGRFDESLTSFLDECRNFD